ncbi:MAG: 16S rRNA (cytosine(1402)-N(4))-methyltransferase RsmH [Acidobacteria bacterium]|nr:16S rRNA (cytosine(1402)-N(4))-methyltransferase RsmH [Acidobacteriota bacterium]
MQHRETDTTPEHAPVLLEEAIQLLGCRRGGRYVDATIGLGGHAQAILERILPGGQLIGLDRDEESLAIARERLARYAPSVRLLHENFKNLPLVLNNTGFRPVDGILIDLGISSFQMLSPGRGFSFRADAKLDMRLDRSQRLTAADLVNSLSEQQLADIIERYGEERHARRIARAIVTERRRGDITGCLQLSALIQRTVPARRIPAIHPATRTFQALRIAVNEELEGLEELLTGVVPFLAVGGRLAVIAFHSLEDRIVKRTFRNLAGHCVCGRRPELCSCPRRRAVYLVTPRAIRPGATELERNPRSRSARLRCVERVGDLGPESRTPGTG